MTRRRWSTSTTMAAATQMPAMNFNQSPGASFNLGRIWLVGLWFNAVRDRAWRLPFALQQKIANDEAIHLCVHEAAISVVRRTDNRLTVHIKRGIDQERAAGGLLEPLQDR